MGAILGEFWDNLRREENRDRLVKMYRDTVNNASPLLLAKLGHLAHASPLPPLHASNSSQPAKFRLHLPVQFTLQIKGEPVLQLGDSIPL